MENRFESIKKVLFEEGITMSELANRINKMNTPEGEETAHKISRHGIAYRFRVGDCLIADMEEMALAAGYEFRWHWEDVGPVPDKFKSARALRPMKSFMNPRLKPIIGYLYQKQMSVPLLGEAMDPPMSRGGIVYRLREGVCLMSDLEAMAKAAGYKLVWSWEKLPATQDHSTL